MLKTKTLAAPPSIALGERPGTITQTRTYEVITPIFGGGTTAGMPDAKLPVNGKSVRGQLRFWWRVMRAGNGKTLDQLQNTEGLMWGTAADEAQQKKGLGPSRVQVHISVLEPGRAVCPFDDRGRVSRTWEEVGYFLFPLQPDAEKNKPAGTVQVGVRFELTLSFPEALRAAVTATLWAWETFGGVGGRTRRGFGALRLQKVLENGKEQQFSLPPSSDFAAVANWIGANAKTHCRFEVAPAGIPQLLNFQPKFQGTAREVWFALAFHYKQFRQWRNGKEVGRGRQEWPEPDAIRNLEETCYEPFEDNCGKFPRGQFGLPVIFHFKDSKSGDPGDFSLELFEFERLASPLILKPLACANNQYSGLAVRLKLQFPQGNSGAVLKPTARQAAARQTRSHPVELFVTQEEVATIEPLANLQTTDPVAAFLAYLKTA